MEKLIEVYDVTLRDGAQGSNISFSVTDKLNIMAALDMLGIAVIEGGQPGISPKEDEFFRRASELHMQKARLAAFGATCRKGVRPEHDAGVRALLSCGAPIVTVFGKSHRLHAEKVLHASPEENLRMIAETIECVQMAGREAIFDAEHFFDGYKYDREYSMSCLRAAAAAGAQRLVLCDTNGGSFPEDISAAVAYVRKELEAVTIGVHFHDDMGMATACTVAGVDAGARHIQGTLTGIGERCGNASLAEIIPSLQLKKKCICLPPEKLRLLCTAARFVASTANVALPTNTPYVGDAAFAHKAGMHIDAMQKLTGAFEHVNPELIGNNRRFLASELAGRATILPVARRVLPELERDSPELEGILRAVKEREALGWQFEAAEASLELLIRKELGLYKSGFDLVYYRTLSQHSHDVTESVAATVKIRVGDKTELACAEGDGPVHALDVALRRALSAFYPEAERFYLTDFKVRVITPSDATAAVVIVWMNTTDGKTSWNTVGVSRDIIEASWLALSDAAEYKLMKA